MAIAFADYAPRRPRPRSTHVRRGRSARPSARDSAGAHRRFQPGPQCGDPPPRREGPRGGRAGRSGSAVRRGAVPRQGPDRHARRRPTANGNRLPSTPMPHDSELVRRFRAAGVLIAGAPTRQSSASCPYTEPLAFGPTHTPGRSRTRRVAPAVLGGGRRGRHGAARQRRRRRRSIRILASCCGLFGLKPSRGFTPTGAQFGELWHGFAIEHVRRARCATASRCSTTAGADGGARTPRRTARRPLLDEVGAPPGRLRIAFTSRPLFGHGPVHADCIAGLEAWRALLPRSLGHHVEGCGAGDGRRRLLRSPSPPSSPARRAPRSILAPVRWPGPAAARRLRAGLVHARPDGPATRAPDYVAAVRTLQLAARTLAPFERHDLLLTPTLARRRS